jgi:hypothetical protein
MRCDEAILKITFLPKGELPFEERQKTINHLHSCANCNKEYQEYLRMFYLINKQDQVKIPEKIFTDFSLEIMDKIENTGQIKFPISRISWYAAAAAIILMFIFILYQKNALQNKINHEVSDVSINDLINKKDWETVLQKFANNDIPEELISISLLLSKFSEIDIELANNILTAKFGKKNDFNNLIQMLIEYQRISDGISTIKIAKYLKNKTGVTS